MITKFVEYNELNEGRNNKLNTKFINEVLRAYLTAALGANNDIDGNLNFTDFNKEERQKARADVKAFVKQVSQQELLDSMSAEDFGHDFWLTRNSDGAGFWDRGLGDVGDRLANLCKGFKAVNVSVGDSGKPIIE